MQRPLTGSRSSSGRPSSDAGAGTAGGDEELIVVGRLTGAYGVNGWVRVASDCDPPENLLTYGPWHLLVDGAWRAEAVLDGHPHGRGVVARLASCTDRERAQALRGTPVGVRRSQLPRLEGGEYYWADLVGLDVVGPGETVLGQVRGLIATGANDVLVVQGDRERLVPYLPGRVVLEVDLAARRIRVDWDPDF